jgi:hypothetical protein
LEILFYSNLNLTIPFTTCCIWTCLKQIQSNLYIKGTEGNLPLVPFIYRFGFPSVPFIYRFGFPSVPFIYRFGFPSVPFIYRFDCICFKQVQMQQVVNGIVKFKLESMFYFQPITRFNIIHTRSTNLFIQSETISIRSHSYLSFYLF